MGRRYVTAMLGVLGLLVLVYSFNSIVPGPPMIYYVTRNSTNATATTTAYATTPEKPDVVVSFDSLRPSRNNVFLIESSCTFLDLPPGGLNITARQACAIYSAALLNPWARVYLLHTCPLSTDYYNQSSECAQKIFDLENVRVVKVGSDPESWFKGTPLEGLAAKLKESSYRLEHTSDVFRLLTLWLFGGTYLDLDFVVIRDLMPLGENWIGAESEGTVSNGAMNFSPLGRGHLFLGQVLKDLKEHYNPSGWSDNGPLLMTRLIKYFCHLPEDVNLQTVGHMESCNLTVYKAKFFYPIFYPSWEDFFRETSLNVVEEASKDSYMIHVWNKLSKETAVTVGSNQPYGKFASQHCRPVYLSAKPNF